MSTLSHVRSELISSIKGREMKTAAIGLLVLSVCFGLSVLFLYCDSERQIAFFARRDSDVQELIQESGLGSPRELATAVGNDPLILDRVDNQILLWRKTCEQFKDEWWARDARLFWQIISFFATWRPPELIWYVRHFAPGVTVTVLSLTLAICCLVSGWRRFRIIIMGVSGFLLSACLMLSFHYGFSGYLAPPIESYDELTWSGVFDNAARSIMAYKKMSIDVKVSYAGAKYSPDLRYIEDEIERKTKILAKNVFWFGMVDLVDDPTQEVVGHLKIDVDTAISMRGRSDLHVDSAGNAYHTFKQTWHVEGMVTLTMRNQQVYSQVIKDSGPGGTVYVSGGESSVELLDRATEISLSPNLFRILVECVGPVALPRAIRKSRTAEIWSERANRETFFSPALYLLGERADETLIGLSRSPNSKVKEGAYELLDLLRKQRSHN